MKHYSEADLLETYYTQPGESMPVMMHLADCADCAARYERLARKMRGLAACEHDKPETFWARQRISVMRKINAERESSFSFARASRIAAAAAIILLLGGVVTRRDDVAVAPQGIENHVNVTLQTTDSTDPWQSDELKPYQSMVAWESWVDSEKKQGDHS